VGSKLGLILSIGIIFFAFIFGADLIMIQLNYTNLDSVSTYVSYKISKDQEISDYLEETLKEKNIYIKNITSKEEPYLEGDTVSYSLTKKYTPLILGRKEFDITITRYAIISIYNWQGGKNGRN